MGICLAALALLAAVAAFWVISEVGGHLRPPALGGAQVSHGPSGS
jgi:hypothetical protein